MTDSGRLITDWEIERHTLVLTSIVPVDGVVYLTAAGTTGWMGEHRAT